MGFYAGLIRRLHSCREAEFGRSSTPQEIELAEEQLGVELPESYEALFLDTSTGPASRAWSSMASEMTFLPTARRVCSGFLGSQLGRISRPGVRWRRALRRGYRRS